MILGVDVSHYQGTINWEQMIAKGVRFAIIKAAEGTSWVDPKFDRNAMECTRLGLPFGSYHYWYPTFDTKLQAMNLVNAMMGHDPKLGLWGDLEQAKPAGSTVDAGARAVSYLTTMAGFYKTGAYTNYYYPKDVLNSNVGLARFPLWAANYGVQSPSIAAPWKFSQALFWQFTSQGDGYAFGAESPTLDLNYWMGTDDDFYAYAGIVAPAPVPVPAPGTEPAIVFTALDKAHLDRVWLDFVEKHPTSAVPA